MSGNSDPCFAPTAARRPLRAPVLCHQPCRGPAREGMEAPLLKQRQEPGNVHRFELPGVPVDGDGHIGGQGDQLPADGQERHARRAGSPACLAPGTLSMFFRMSSSVPNSCSSLAAVLTPMPATPGTLSTESPTRVCRSIDLFGLDAPVGQQLVAAESSSLAEVEHADPVAEQLPAILVGGADEHVLAARGAGAGEGGDDVVGLEARMADDGDGHGVESLLDQGDLQVQIAGHGRPMGLVIGVDVAAERRLGAVEGADQAAAAAAAGAGAGRGKSRTGRWSAGRRGWSWVAGWRERPGRSANERRRGRYNC